MQTETRSTIDRSFLQDQTISTTARRIGTILLSYPSPIDLLQFFLDLPSEQGQDAVKAIDELTRAGYLPDDALSLAPLIARNNLFQSIDLPASG